MAITIDEMLGLLSFAGDELGSGNDNHGPIYCETAQVCYNGRDVPSLLSRYKA